jgi:O-antigen ligase
VPPSPDSSPFLRASLLLTGLAWTVPLLQPYHRYPLTAFYSEFLAFALGLAALAPLLRGEPWRNAALPAVAIAPAGLITVLAIQVALGRINYPGQALTAGLYLSWALLLMLLGQVLSREFSLARVAATLAWFALGGGVLHALVGLAQHYGLHGAPLGGLVARKGEAVVYGNLGQANHYAASVALALASACYLHACRKLHVAAAGGCAALLLLALMLSGSRSSWLYLAAFLLLAFPLNRMQPGAESRRLAVFAVSLVPGLYAAQALAALPFMVPPEGPMATIADRLFQVASGVDARLQLAREAWRMFLAAPLLGAGFGQFSWEHFLHQAATGASAAPGVFNHAHNVVMQLVAEFGAAGALIVLGPVLLWMADLRRVNLAPEWWWLLALLSVIGLHSMLEYPLWYAYFLGMAALLLGLGAQRGVAMRRTGAARAALAALLAAGCFNLAVVIAPYREFERLVFAASPRTPPRPGAQEFPAALMRAHREPLLTPYVELAFALGAPLDAGRIREQLDLNSRAMRFAPLDAVVYRQALLLSLAGEREAARAQFTRALTVYPGEAATAVSELEHLARRHPAEMTPLLEWAAAELAQRNTRRGIE